MIIEIKAIQDKQTLLNEPTKEDLVDEIFRLRDENATLKKELELKNKKALKFVSEKRHLKKRWNKLGAKKGHHGYTRSKPTFIDHEVHLTLNACPDCMNKELSEAPSHTQEHIQEDIVPAPVEATKFIHHAYWCSDCNKIKIAPHAKDEIPNSYLGPNILVQTVLMKYHHGLSYDKMKTMFYDFHNLKVTSSALAQALQRMSKWLNVEEKIIIEAIRLSPYLHMDETGWKIAGYNHWLWSAVNERLALYQVRQSRGRKVPEEILTKEYQGIIISDFLSAYDKSGKRRQRCLVHLVRDMKKYRELDESEESQKAYMRLNRILKDALRLDKYRHTYSPIKFLHRVKLVKERLFNFASDVFKSKYWQTISKRLLKFYNEILTFLDVPGLPTNNNHAERMIRPNVIFRKISFQNMSEKGARAHEVLMSLLQTLRLRKQDPINYFKKAYLIHRQGSAVPILSP